MYTLITDDHVLSTIKSPKSDLRAPLHPSLPSSTLMYSLHAYQPAQFFSSTACHKITLMARGIPLRSALALVTMPTLTGARCRGLCLEPDHQWLHGSEANCASHGSHTKMTSKPWNRMASRSIPVGHKTRGPDFETTRIVCVLLTVKRNNIIAFILFVDLSTTLHEKLKEIASFGFE